MRKINRLIFIIIILLFISAFNSNAMSVYEDNIVRVGICELPGFLKIDEGADIKGYEKEYLDEIALYTGWKYEYISGTWEDCQDWLRTGEVDVIGNIQKNDSEEPAYQYTDISTGNYIREIYVSENNNFIGYEDFKNFSGIRIAGLSGSSDIEACQNYLNEKGVNAEIVEYNKYSEMISALKQGKVEAMIASNYLQIEGVKRVAKFDVSDSYFVVANDKEQILEGFNFALKQICVSNENYNSELYKKYYSNRKVIDAFSPKEIDYIQKNPDLQIAVDNNWELMSYSDKEKQYKGINQEFLELIARNSGFKFQYVECNDNKTKLSKLKSNKVQATISILGNHVDSESSVKTTDSYYKIILVLLSEVDVKTSDRFKLALPKYFELLEKEIFKAYPNVTIQYFQSGQQCLNAVKSGKVTATLLDNNNYNLYSGLEAYKEIEIESTYGDMYSLALNVRNDNYILLSILNKSIARITDEETQVCVIDGVHDFEKANTAMLLFRTYKREIFSGILIFILLISTIWILYKNRKEKEYEKKAYTDSVTGINNWDKFCIEAVDKLNCNESNKYAYVLLDLDKFKIINSRYGISEGDKALLYVAEALKENTTRKDVIARVYADVFCMLIHYDEELDIIRKISSIILKLERYNVGPKLSAVFGIYKIEDKSVSLNLINDRANLAKNTVKQNSVNAYAFYDVSVMDKIIQETDITNSMTEALKTGQFKLFLQPKYSLKTGKIESAEALVRWVHPEKGIISPNEFIPLFERKGLIKNLDYYIWEQACKTMNKWEKQGLGVLPIAINVSKVHLYSMDLVNKLQSLTQTYGIKPRNLELEITERLFCSDSDLVLKMMNRIKQNDFLFTMDDFGSEYSSLKLLKQMPIDVLKIDQEFLAEISLSDKVKIVIRDVINMAKHMNILVVCEGVETKEQADFLKETNCDYVQGYYYSKALSVEAFEKLLITQD
ncbi:EAL domain-containing protein [Anaerosacchariphilus polymeriproducens]|uniref:EAL domain-containing protein n=1 Tax=Anaerosacchariphilus polymeriproducens TaxID=1812858 RepID=A0A371AXG8_9FIRM|nr:EAL domain-containing protein [Anaerosacchariphilus polymeriproducens]RDU24275.1 EAL domain-containing protein [Anaerosacchariphilus polymeriproducens]